eukprot:799329_1
MLCNSVTQTVFDFFCIRTSSMQPALAALAITCITCNFISILWLLYQYTHFIQNPKFNNHQAFKIRGKTVFLLTAIVMIINIIFRPILVSLSLIDLILVDSAFWRGVMDFVQMSLYAIIEFRCWITYFNLNASTAVVDQQFKKHLDKKPSDTNDCFRYCQSILGRSSYIGAFFALHGILCVIICGLVEEYHGFDPHRIMCHFFVANIFLIILFIHRMYFSITRAKHTDTHDMLSVNRELNLITMIMSITAICDSALGFFMHSYTAVNIPYTVYQTVLIGVLCIVIFYFPQRTITRLLDLENAMTMRDSAGSLHLKHVFTNMDLYHVFIRFTIQEWSSENLMFVTHWMQIQKIIEDSGIDVKVNTTYTCDASSCELMKLPFNDVLLCSKNILEATRGIYDTFVNTNDIMQINIGHDSRKEVDTFFDKHNNIRTMPGVYGQTSSIEQKVGSTSDTDQIAEKYQLFIQQLQNEAIERDVIQEMVDAYSGAVRDCWDNTFDSFSRFHPKYMAIMQHP